MGIWGLCRVSSWWPWGTAWPGWWGSPGRWPPAPHMSPPWPDVSPSPSPWPSREATPRTETRPRHTCTCPGPAPWREDTSSEKQAVFSFQPRVCSLCRHRSRSRHSTACWRPGRSNAWLRCQFWRSRTGTCPHTRPVMTRVSGDTWYTWWYLVRQAVGLWLLTRTLAWTLVMLQLNLTANLKFNVFIFLSSISPLVEMIIVRSVKIWKKFKLWLNLDTAAAITSNFEERAK